MKTTTALLLVLMIIMAHHTTIAEDIYFEGITSMSEYIGFAARTKRGSNSDLEASNVKLVPLETDAQVVTHLLGTLPSLGVHAPPSRGDSGDAAFLSGGFGVALESENKYLQRTCTDYAFLQDDERGWVACKDHLSVVPVVGSYLVPIANLPGVPNLTLSPLLVMEIWEGKITTWDHPAIAVLNPSATLPSQPIQLSSYVDRTLDSVFFELSERLATLDGHDHNSTSSHDVQNATFSARSNIWGESVHAADAAANTAVVAVRDTLYSFTVLRSEVFAKWEGAVSPVRLLVDDHVVPFSRGAVVLEMEALHVETLTTLVSGVANGWPLTYIEWAILPFSPSQVSPAYCANHARAVHSIEHFLTSLFVLDHASEYGHVRLPDPVIEQTLHILGRITCNGETVIAHPRLARGKGHSLAEHAVLLAESLYNYIEGASVSYEPVGNGYDFLVPPPAPVESRTVDLSSARSVHYADEFTAFALVDEPPTPAVLSVFPSLRVLPIAASSIALPYKLSLKPGAPPSLAAASLTLSRAVLTKIFMGDVTMWNDPRVSALNPDLAPFLPNATICVFLHTGTSSATHVLTTLMSQVSSDWADSIGPASHVPLGTWPGENNPGACFLHHDTMDGIARGIGARSNVLGYLDYSTARTHLLRSVALVTKADSVVLPSSEAAMAAALKAEEFLSAPDPRIPFVKSLVNQDHQDAWPLVAYSYIVLEDEPHSPTPAECDQRAEAVYFAHWLMVSRDASLLQLSLGLSPIPNTTAVKVDHVLTTMTCGGKLLIDPCHKTGSCFLAPAHPDNDSGLSPLIIGVLASSAVVFICLACLAAFVLRKRDVVFKLEVDQDLLIPTDELEVLSTIGSGSFGTVYKAKWRGSPMAIKQIHGLEHDVSKLAEFVDESTVLMKLRHPHIVLFLGIVIDPAGLVIEYLPNGSLFDVLHDQDLNLEPNLVMWWAHSIATGLDFLNHAGIVHRDMKSLNVLLDAGYVPKIADFGLSSSKADGAAGADKASRKAKRARAKKLRALRTASSGTGSGPRQGSDGSTGWSASNGRGSSGGGIGSFSGSTARNSAIRVSNVSGGGQAAGLAGGNLGSLLWVSPEILNSGPSVASEASDVYAFAITVWEILTRMEPYAGRSPITVALEVSMGSTRPSLSLVPEWAASVVPTLIDAWDQDPGARPTFSALARIFETRFIRSRIALPRKSELPSGSVVLALVSYTRSLSFVEQNPHGAREELEKMHTAIREATKASGGQIADWSLTQAVVVFHAPLRFPDFAYRILSKDISTLLVCAGLGDISAQTISGSLASDSHIQFSGPVVTSVLQTRDTLHRMRGSNARGIFTSQALAAPLEGYLQAERENQASSAVEGTGPSYALVALDTSIIEICSPFPARLAPERSIESPSGFATSPSLTATLLSESRVMSSSHEKRKKSRSSQSHKSTDENSSSSGLSSSSSSSSSSSASSGTEPVSRATLTSISKQEGGATAMSHRAVSAMSASSRTEITMDDKFGGKKGSESRDMTMARINLSSLSSPFFISSGSMRGLVQRSMNLGVGAFAKVVVSDLNGESVLVKILLDQKMTHTSLIGWATGMASIAVQASQLPTGTMLAPIGACLVPPYVGVVYPFCSHGSIGTFVEESGSSSSTATRDQMLDIIQGTAYSLRELHNHGGVHGSLKPNNLLLGSAHGSPVFLADAGVAAIKCSLSTMTMSPSVAYQAPEILMGQPESTAADVFAFGCVMYEIIAGKPAFGGVNAMQCAFLIQQGTLPDLSQLDISPSVSRLIESCWLPHPPSRPSMVIVCEMLQSVDQL